MAGGLVSKAFKSGNSVALRLPKSMGIEAGDEVVVVAHADKTFSLWKRSDAVDVLMSLYGSFSPGFMSEGRGEIEQAPRPGWDEPDDHAVAA